MPHRIAEAIRDVPDFPTEGIIFKDISPILENPELFRLSIDLMADHYTGKKLDMIVAIDARGFIFGSALAYKMGCGLTMLRKKGKLPWKTRGISYDLEYGSNEMEIHEDAISPGDHILLVDDVLATGGTAEAAVKLITDLGGKVVALCCLMELCFLDGRKKMPDLEINCLVEIK